MTDETRNLQLWPDATAYYDDGDYAIYSSYSRIGARHHRAFSSVLPRAFIDDEENDDLRREDEPPAAPPRQAHIQASAHDPRTPAWQNWFTAIVVPLIFFAVIASLCRQSRSNETRCAESRKRKWNTSFDELIDKFPSQPAHVWALVKEAQRSNAEAPVILMMLANVGNKAMLDRFAVATAEMLASNRWPPYSVITVNASQLANTSNAGELLQTTLLQGKPFVAVISDVHLMSMNLVSILHSFFDEMSPYSGNIFLFTLTSPIAVESLPRDKHERIAESILDKAWKDKLHLGYRSSLVARLTGNAVAIWPDRPVEKQLKRTQA